MLSAPENHSAESCSTNAQCQERNGGGPFVCRKRDHVCVSLITQECPKVLAEPETLGADDVVILGHIGAPSLAPSLAAIPDALDLARRELQTVTGGVPPVVAGGKPRPLAIVACDVGDDVTAASTAARHLATDLEVPAIISSMVSPRQETEVATQVTVPSRTLLLSTILRDAPDPPDDDLIFRLGPSARGLARVASPFFAYLEAKVRAATGAPIRVALVIDATTPAETTNALVASLTLEGTPIGRHPNFRTFSRQDTSAVGSLVAFAPAIVIHAIAPDASFVGMIERGLAPGGVPPRHLFALPGAKDVIARDLPETVHPRCSALEPEAPDYDETKEKAFDLQLRATSPSVTISTAVRNAYDAPLMLAYGLASPATTNGKTLAAALLRFDPAGRPASGGASDLAAGFSAIASGAPIDYRGVDGAVRWSPTGERRHDALAWCSRAGQLVRSGLRFDDTRGVVTGQAQCD